MKRQRELDPMELMCLEASRGLNIDLPHAEYRDHRGLKPSIKDYNEAIRQHIYTGVPIPDSKR